MDNWIVLVVRHDKGKKMVVPIMNSDDDNKDALAMFGSKLKAMEVCSTHILAKASDCIILNIDSLEAEDH